MNGFDYDLRSWQQGMKALLERFMSELEDGTESDPARLYQLRELIEQRFSEAEQAVRGRREGRSERGGSAAREAAAGAAATGSASAFTITPRADVLESETAVLLVLDAPGAGKEDVSVSFKEGQLTVTAVTKGKDAPKGAKVLMNETVSGRYQRTFMVPEQYDAAGAKAAVQDGIITVTLPKRKKEPPRKIAIGS